MRRWITVDDKNVVIKTILERYQTQVVQFVGEYENEYYKNQFSLAGMDIRSSFEVTDAAEDLDVFELAKPLLIFYPNKIQRNEKGVKDGSMNVEFQIVVNSEPQGALQIAGYMALLQALCNPKKGQWRWLPYGLAPRFTREGSILNGSRIHEKLTTRILTQSLLVTFDLIEGDS